MENLKQTPEHWISDENEKSQYENVMFMQAMITGQSDPHKLKEESFDMTSNIVYDQAGHVKMIPNTSYATSVHY